MDNPAWSALREETEDFVGRYARPIPQGGIEDLIGYLSYCIVRDTTAQLVATVEARAAAAPDEDEDRDK